MRITRLVTGIVVTLGLTTAIAAAQPRAPGRPGATRRAAVPSVAVQYRDALRSWFPVEAQQALAGVDVAAAARARRTALVFVAVDHAVRRFAPMAIDASGRTSQSVRLRRLGAIRDDATARAARTSIALTQAALQSAATMSRQPRIEAALDALRSAEAAVILASQMLEECGPPRPGKAPSYAAETCAIVIERAVTECSNVAESALEAGARSDTVVAAALDSLRAMSRPVATRPARDDG